MLKKNKGEITGWYTTLHPLRSWHSNELNILMNQRNYIMVIHLKRGKMDTKKKKTKKTQNLQQLSTLLDWIWLKSEAF